MNRPEFTLRVHDSDKTKIFKASIRNPKIGLLRYIPAPDFMISVSQKLLQKTVKHHIMRVVMRVSNITGSTQSTVVSNIHIGQLPKGMFIGFVAAEVFHGRTSRNPFYFQHFNLSQLSVEVDRQSYFTKPYTADFSKKQYSESYDELLDTLWRMCDPYGALATDCDEYANGYTIFGFGLTCGSTGAALYL